MLHVTSEIDKGELDEKISILISVAVISLTALGMDLDSRTKLQSLQQGSREMQRVVQRLMQQSENLQSDDPRVRLLRNNLQEFNQRIGENEHLISEELSQFDECEKARQLIQKDEFSRLRGEIEELQRPEIVHSEFEEAEKSLWAKIDKSRKQENMVHVRLENSENSK